MDPPDQVPIPHSTQHLLPPKKAKSSTRTTTASTAAAPGLDVEVAVMLRRLLHNVQRHHSASGKTGKQFAHLAACGETSAPSAAWTTGAQNVKMGTGSLAIIALENCGEMPKLT